MAPSPQTPEPSSAPRPADAESPGGDASSLPDLIEPYDMDGDLALSSTAMPTGAGPHGTVVIDLGGSGIYTAGVLESVDEADGSDSEDEWRGALERATRETIEAEESDDEAPRSSGVAVIPTICEISSPIRPTRGGGSSEVC